MEGTLTKMKPMPKTKAKATAAATTTVKHARKPKAAEVDAVEKGRRIAAALLVQRDGMDEETAAMVVAGLEPEQINDLVVEANTRTIDNTNLTQSQVTAAAAAPAAEAGATLSVDADSGGDVPDFTTVEALVSNEEFPELVQGAVDSSKAKNEAESAYKLAKAKIIAIMNAAGYAKVACMGIRLAVYTGHTRTLDARKLLAKGVSIDTINACYSDTPYDDVRLTVPKVQVPANG